MCMSCGKTLGVLELIPVLSFFIQRGRCSGCKTPISFQYPIIELLTGGLAVISLYVSLINMTSELNILFTYVWFVSLFIISTALLVIAVYDSRYLIIPDGAVLTIIAGAVGVISVRSLAFSPELYAPWYSGILTALILGGAFYLLWFLTKGRGLGFGDVKLVAALGLTLTLEQGIAMALLSFWIGAVYAIVLLGISRLFKRGMESSSSTIGLKTAIPFGPFIVIAAYIVLYTGMTFTHIMEKIDSILTFL
jgi:prepilin signal peptidase PulO-like enzyme (type II secretory pathway)